LDVQGDAIAVIKAVQEFAYRIRITKIIHLVIQHKADDFKLSSPKICRLPCKPQRLKEILTPPQNRE